MQEDGIANDEAITDLDLYMAALIENNPEAMKHYEDRMNEINPPFGQWWTEIP